MAEPVRDYHGRFTHGIVDSLEAQLRKKGHGPNEARSMAIEILTERGHLDKEGNLTEFGLHRQSLGREERRKDVAARQLGRKPEHMAYDKRTGKAYVK